MSQSGVSVGMGDGRDRDDETGQYAAKVTRDGILGVFDAVDGPVIGSGDVAKHLDCTTQAARDHLSRLEAEGVLASRQIGRSLVYWCVSEKGDGGDDT